MASDQKSIKVKEDEAGKKVLWGGNGGQEWPVDKAFFASHSMTKITIRSGDFIDNIKFCYDDNNDKDRWFGMDTGVGGIPEVIDLGASKQLTTVEGWYAKLPGNLVVITWLKFEDSDGKSYGPYGKIEKGTRFHFVTPKNEKIVGFLGRGGSYLDAIGVYTIRKTLRLTEWGGDEGTPWDMEQVIGNPSTRLTKIIIGHGDLINSIEYNYEVDGQLKMSGKKGGAGQKESEFDLELDEYINGIRGYYSLKADTIDPEKLTRLTFYTNKNRRYGPYGFKRGRHFSISAGDTGRIVGFHGGFSEGHLDALGVYMVPK